MLKHYLNSILDQALHSFKPWKENDESLGKGNTKEDKIEREHNTCYVHVTTKFQKDNSKFANYKTNVKKSIQTSLATLILSRFPVYATVCSPTIVSSKLIWCSGWCEVKLYTTIPPAK